MTVLEHNRLSADAIEMDYAGIRAGKFSDAYFSNVVKILEGASLDGYRFEGNDFYNVNAGGEDIGNLVVDAQIFTRHPGQTIVAGVDACLQIIKNCTGFWNNGVYVNTFPSLVVEAVEDGSSVLYQGDPKQVQPVIKIRGRYRDFANLETVLLGMLGHGSRIATSVYNVLRVANKKPIMFYPARFDIPETQGIDGYAYWTAIQAYAANYGVSYPAMVSTDAQAQWWNGKAGGTTPHALIASFMADDREAMRQFAKYLPLTTPRIALVDFHNNVVADAVYVAQEYFRNYFSAYMAGDTEGMSRWTLFGVRLDTSGSQVDVGLANAVPTNFDTDRGVSLKLVNFVRTSLDQAAMDWNVNPQYQELANQYVRNIKIVVTGGFNRDKINMFETNNAPVDLYGVGSTFLKNDDATNTDFTMDIVSVYLQQQNRWVNMAKQGRAEGSNTNLKVVDLSTLK